MTIRFIDGFDHYATADINLKWTGQGGQASTITTGGRNSTNCWKSNNGHWQSGIYKTFSSGKATWVIGFAVYFGDGTAGQVLSFIDGGSSGTIHVGLTRTASGTLQVWRASTSNVLGTGTIVTSSGVWYYVEIKVVIDDTNGGVHTRINGITDLKLGAYADTPVSLDTRNAGNASADCIKFFCITNSGTGHEIRLEDIYIADGDSGQNFLGDVKVETLLPNGDGNSSGWMGSDTNQTNNYALVDESSQNGDTDYVYTSTVNAVDTYAFPSLATSSGVIYAVQHNLWARKDDAGSRSIGPVVRHSSSDYVGTTIALTDSYVDQMVVQEANPGTSTSWSITDINNAEFGVKLLA